MWWITSTSHPCRLNSWHLTHPDFARPFVLAPDFFFLLELGRLRRSLSIPWLDITKAGCPRKSIFSSFWHDPCVSLPRNLKKWISAARQREVHPPEPRSMEPQGSKQLNKLLAKEEHRLEQEQKRASVERRRKQQQEQFQLQHELNHPLRQHHPQNAKTLRG